MFRGSSPEDFAPLLPSLSRRRYDPGRYLWRAGDPADWMYVVLSGEVIVSSLGSGGERYVLEVFVRGDTMGQLPFFEQDRVRLFDASAERESECLVAPRQAVLGLLRTRPELMMCVLAAYSRWIRTRDMHASDAAFQNLAGRVACKLVELGNRYGELSPDGVRIPIRLTHEKVANMLGASRENVSRALSRLARHGEVRRQGGVLLIPRLEELAQRYSSFQESPGGLASRAAGGSA